MLTLEESSTAKTITIEDPPWQLPSHRALTSVHRVPNSYDSYATSLVALPAGSLFTPITNHFFIKQRTWPPVASSSGLHIDLNSDLFYANHSCRPSLEFDVSKMEARVSRYRDLEVGELLTFFYPSTEWAMVQPFECFCKERGCLGKISGADETGRERLEGYWLNEHVEKKLTEQEEVNREKVAQAE